MAKAPNNDATISIMEIDSGVAEFCILGTSPLIFNRMSEKTKRIFLLGGNKKTKAEKAENEKHNPPQEYRDSVNRFEGNDQPTRLCFPAPAFKGALASAALDVPGARKTEIGRLSWVEGFFVPIYGVPRLFMSVVRSADLNKTPDIRTRALLPEWACRVRFRFVKPILQHQAVANLLAAAGVTIGIGDFRQEKGKGSFGQFALVSADDPDFVRITAEQGRDAQDLALEDPIPYDADTAEMLGWFVDESVKRGRAA